MITVTKVISSRIDSSNRLLVKFTRMGKDDTQETLTSAPYGIDSNPIKDMIALHATTGVSGESVLIGYINKNAIADIGELRLFSTDESGTEVMYLHLKNDSTMEIGGNNDYMVRYSKLETAFNQLKSDFNSLVSIFNTHVHTGVTPGVGSSGPTPLSVASSGADITPAKILKIKTYQ